MERAVCEQCGHWQPGDWAPGDLCVACGAAVRREVRCAWCAEWTPAVKFCRACACEVVSPEQYGPARMLKSAGVDRFSLVQRLRELDPDQAANLGRIYNAQLAVVARRVEEVRLCETCLVQTGFARRLQEELVPQLPLEKEALAALAAGPAGPFDARPELLPEIAQASPVPLARTLASIALVRLGHFKGAYDAACQALWSNDSDVALEAALAFPHWRVRLCPYELWRPRQPYSWASPLRGIEAPKLAEVAGAVPPGSPLRPWAAAALTLAWCRAYGVAPEPQPGGRAGETPPEWLREELRAGLTSRDPDLRFTCAMALGEDGLVARALAADDPRQVEVARICLAKHKSPAIAPLLTGGPEEIRDEILDNLWAPLPEALVDPVLRAVEQTSDEKRANAVRLLLENLTESLVERLIRLAQRKRAPEVLKLLLRVEGLPAAREVVRAVLKGGWFEILSEALPEHLDFTDNAVVEVAANGDAEAVGMLIWVAERQLDRLAGDEPVGGPGRGAGVARFLVRAAFGSGPAEVRERAYRLLEYRDERQWNWLSRDGIRELFGNAAGFLKAAAPVLEDAGLEGMRGDLLRKLAERWPGVGELLADDRGALKGLVKALRQRAGQDSDAVRVLVKAAAACPQVALPAVTALLKESGSKWELRDVAADLLAEYNPLKRRIGRDAGLAKALAEALVTTLGAVTLESRYLPALELLTRLAQDDAGLRPDIAKRTAAILKDREWGDRMLRPALDALAEAVDFKEVPDEPPPEVAGPPSIPNEVFDNMVLVPDVPLKTLAEYCAFLKAMGEGKDPLAVMASYGLTPDSMGECVTRWGEVISSNDQIAMRYASLVAP